MLVKHVKFFHRRDIRAYLIDIFLHGMPLNDVKYLEITTYLKTQLATCKESKDAVELLMYYLGAYNMTTSRLYDNLMDFLQKKYPNISVFDFTIK